MKNTLSVSLLFLFLLLFTVSCKKTKKTENRSENDISDSQELITEGKNEGLENIAAVEIKPTTLQKRRSFSYNITADKYKEFDFKGITINAKTSKDFSDNNVYLEVECSDVEKFETQLECDIYIEALKIVEISSNLFVLTCASLGYEKIFALDVLTRQVDNYFFDMESEVAVRQIDYENKIIFGDTWNSDKGIHSEQLIEFYMFSTARQAHYKIDEKRGNVFFVELLGDCKAQYVNNDGENVVFDYSKYIAESNEKICEDNNKVFFDSLESLSCTYYDCTSYLKERTKSYPVENLCSLADSSPWVEAVEGYGIGEGFSIKNTDGKVFPTLLLINGYISYEKPYFYKQNSRVKKIKVTGIKSGKSKVLDVYDVPHPQTIDISFITEPEELRIEIADVYEGSKYDDTCIHYIVPWDKEVIPYETSID